MERGEGRAGWQGEREGGREARPSKRKGEGGNGGRD